MSIVAVDPGVTTGVAIYPGNVVTSIKGMKDALRYLELYITADTTIVIERYTSLTPMNKYGDETLRMVGAVEALATLRAADVRFQTPYEIRWYKKQKNAFFHEIGWKTNNQHTRDAVSHLLLYLDKMAHQMGIPDGFVHRWPEDVPNAVDWAAGPETELDSQ